MADPQGLSFPLFAPANRPDRVAKARASRATCIIADLEDAVAPDLKEAARSALAEQLNDHSGLPLYVRINAFDTPWFEDDLAMVLGCGATGIVLPKAEDAKRATALKQRLAPNTQLIGLIETVSGIAQARALAHVFDRLHFGSLDYAVSVDCAHTEKALAHARAELILAARLAGKPGPVDGVTPDAKNSALVCEQARYSSEMGFKGKLLIHPAQIEPVKQGFRPSSDEISWANGIIAAGASNSSGVAMYQGAMVDAPVIARAHRLLERVAQTQAA
ncbi:MAG: HpcH/HpaI aldolase/citrate lyase family protein [Paracoccaceae bacterium]